MCGSLSNLEVGCCARAVPWCVVLRRPPETARRSRRGPDVRRGTVQCARSVQFNRRVNDGSLISRLSVFKRYESVQSGCARRQTGRRDSTIGWTVTRPRPGRAAAPEPRHSAARLCVLSNRLGTPQPRWNQRADPPYPLKASNVKRGRWSTPGAARLRSPASRT